ncbi:hypothetical protein VNI00_017875 [Paramarasmius palmivorus]|uniref:Mid2 domain-containing protein n=1 Tax=Paramarasmius palmivorus TaxID=297713 RepID=A0AAW0B3C3_9AGAR
MSALRDSSSTKTLNPPPTSPAQTGLTEMSSASTSSIPTASSFAVPPSQISIIQKTLTQSGPSTSTTENTAVSTSQAGSSQSPGMIAGLVVGAVGLMVIVSIIFVVLQRRRKKKLISSESTEPTLVSPYPFFTSIFDQGATDQKQELQVGGQHHDVSHRGAEGASQQPQFRYHDDSGWRPQVAEGQNIIDMPPRYDTAV